MFDPESLPMCWKTKGCLDVVSLHHLRLGAVDFRRGMCLRVPRLPLMRWGTRRPVLCRPQDTLSLKLRVGRPSSGRTWRVAMSVDGHVWRRVTPSIRHCWGDAGWILELGTHGMIPQPIQGIVRESGCLLLSYEMLTRSASFAPFRAAVACRRRRG